MSAGITKIMYYTFNDHGNNSHVIENLIVLTSPSLMSALAFSKQLHRDQI